MELDVRIGNARAAADEAAGLEMVAAAEAAAGQEPAAADQGAPPRGHLRVKRDGLARGHLEVKLQVVLQVLTDPLEIVHHVDAEVGEFLARPDAGELQQLRRVDGPAADDHFASRPHLVAQVVAPVAHAHRAPALEQDARGQRVRAHLQIGAVQRRAQIGVGRTAAPARAHRHIHAPEALLLVAVHVLGQRVAGLPPGFEPGGVQGVGEQATARGERSGAAAIVIGAFRTAFGAPEVGQHVAVPPAAGTRGTPSARSRARCHAHTRGR